MLGDRIREARSIAKRYDRLDQYGKSLVSLIIDHEAARVAASEQDEFDLADLATWWGQCCTRAVHKLCII